MLPLLLAKLDLFTFAAACAKHAFFFFPPWWEYINTSTGQLGQCIVNVSGSNGTFELTDLLPIGLAILDMLLRVAGFIAVISIIIAGAEHIFSGGDPQKAASARKRIYNSFIGLALAFIATAIVTFIGKQLG